MKISLKQKGTQLEATEFEDISEDSEIIIETDESIFVLSFEKDHRKGYIRIHKSSIKTDHTLIIHPSTANGLLFK